MFARRSCAWLCMSACCPDLMSPGSDSKQFNFLLQLFFMFIFSLLHCIPSLILSLLSSPFQGSCSSPESLKFYHPVDPNSYSPQDSFSSSSSSSCYNSPSRMESGHSGFTNEHFHYQHCTPQDCYCLPSFWMPQQESYPVSEYVPHYTQTDYSYGSMEENYFKRDCHMSSEMCYNVLC